jgi:hypothetical protein
MEAMIFAEELLLCLRKRGGKRKNPGIGATNLGRGNDKAQFDRFSRCRFEAISGLLFQFGIIFEIQEPLYLV